MRQLEGAGNDPGDVRLVLQDLRELAADVGRARLEPEDPVGDVVHHRDAAVGGDREHAVAQVPDQVAVEIFGRYGIGPPDSTAGAAGLGSRLTVLRARRAATEGLSVGTA